MNTTDRAVRRVLAATAAVLLLSHPLPATPAAHCYQTQQHHGLFCNDGSPITVCQGIDGCTVQCGDNSPIPDVAC